MSTPQLPEDKEEDPRLKPAAAGETPEQAFARRQEELAENEAHEPQSFLSREPHHESHESPDSRFSMKQRFPSRDIWEDSPDSLQLQTTVGEEQGEDKDAPASAGAGAVATAAIATAAKPLVPARPTRTKSTDSQETAHPVVPSRPSEKSKLADGPSPPLPTKAKPQIPARPSKPIARNSSENVLTKVPSDSSAKSSGSDQGAAGKPKPPVPSRPVGSKIAALQSGFMLDLNKRLQLGPHAPKKEEPAAEVVEEEKEKAPLADARKGRARGPARRAPAKSPAPATSAAAVEKPKVTCGLWTPSTLWQIHPEDDLLVASHHEEAASGAESKLSEPESAPAPSSKAEQESHVPSHSAPSDSVPTSEFSASQDSVAEEAHTEQPTEATKEVVPPKVDDSTPAQAEEAKEAPITSEDAAESETAGEALSASVETVKPETEEVAE